jgi:elongation factor Ts
VHNTYATDFGRTAAAVVLEAPGASESAREVLLDLGQKLAMHIVAASPQYLSRESVPADKVEEEAAVVRAQISATMSKKPPEVIEKILNGKLAKFFDETVLLEQNYVLEDAGKVRALVAAQAKELGVDITVAGFVRYHLGATKE